MRWNQWISRRFLKSAGVAAGTAAVVGAPGPARAATDGGRRSSTRPAPLRSEPVVVYVRDAARGEVTVLSASTEKTYRDRVLVERLLKAARDTESDAKGVA